MEFHVHWCFVGEERQMLSAVHDDQKRPAADQTMQMDIMKSRNGRPTGYWTEMRHSWGAIWRMDSNHRLQGPFSMRITSDSGKTLVANNVIPAYWRPDKAYWSNVQFY